MPPLLLQNFNSSSINIIARKKDTNSRKLSCEFPMEQKSANK